MHACPCAGPGLGQKAGKPGWLRQRAPQGERYEYLAGSLRSLGLHTVCEEAQCPNVGECWNGGSGTATIMLLGARALQLLPGASPSLPQRASKEAHLLRMRAGFLASRLRLVHAGVTPVLRPPYVLIAVCNAVKAQCALRRGHMHARLPILCCEHGAHPCAAG